jgi:hypothetical protein
MSYCTFADAKEFVKEGAGTCDDAELAKIVNTIRQHWHFWYADLPLFLDAVSCFAVHRYWLSCNDCSNSYCGITLPRDFQTIEAAWFNDYPIELRSSWREFQTGISPECACSLQKLDMPGQFSTFLDIPSATHRRLKVMCFNKADEGKRLLIRGIDLLDRPYAWDVKLTMAVQLSPIEFKLINPQGGILKDRTVGRVIVQDDESRTLGIYEPDETLPAYRRVKITGIPDGCSVINIRAARRYFPLYDNDDVVETDNAVAFDAMSRYLRLNRKSSKTQAELIVEKDYLATARALMIGEKSRDRGKGASATVAIATPNFGRHSLSRFGRAW